MSREVILLVRDAVSPETLTGFVIEVGGERHPVEDYIYKDGRTIWLSLEPESLDEVMPIAGEAIVEELGAVPRSYVNVKISSSGDGRLALEFCLAFMARWTSIVWDGLGGYWSRDELLGALHNREGFGAPHEAMHLEIRRRHWPFS